MSVLARASADAIDRALGDRPAFARVRGPDIGLVMARGRAGGGGAPFNFGEVAVTRCTVRTEDGVIGHAYVLGRDKRHAELAALADAMMQSPVRRSDLETRLIAPLEAAEIERRSVVAAKAEATKVRFFAMQNMRGG